MMLAERTNFFLEALSNELGVFMMRIVNGKFAHHIMNTHRRRPKHLHDVDSKARFTYFLLSVFGIKNVNLDQ
jgi:hypothetical protein